MKEIVQKVAKEGNVELAELAGAVDGFKASMDEQDVQFEQQEEELRSRSEGVTPEVDEELAQMRTITIGSEGADGSSWEDGQRDYVSKNNNDFDMMMMMT